MSVELDPVQFRHQLIHDMKEALWEILHEGHALNLHHGPAKSGFDTSFSELLQQLAATHSEALAELHSQVTQLKASQELPITQNGVNKNIAFGMAPTIIDLDGLSNHSEKTAVSLGTAGDNEPPKQSVTIKSPRAAVQEAGVALKVVIVDGKEIRRPDSILGTTPHSPYCSCSIVGKAGSGFSTNSARRSHSPTWNHDEILFDYFPGDDLSFAVFDRDSHGNTILLGTADLDSSTFFPTGFDGELPLGHQGCLLNIKIDIATKGPLIPVLPASLKVVSAAPLKKKSYSGIFGKEHSLGIDINSSSIDSRNRASMIPMLIGKQRCPPAAIAPDAPSHLVWDICGVFVLMIDLLWIPMQVFDPELNPFVRVLTWVILLYWTGDMIMNFNTGFYTKISLLNLRRLDIAKRYCQGWFIFDMLLVSIDWYNVIHGLTGEEGVGEGAGAARAGRLARLTRLIRLLRLMRLAKLRRLLFIIQSLVDSEWLAVSFSVVKNMLLILMLNHYMACVWFIVGKSSGAEGWVYRLSFDGVDTGTQYLESLVWSLAQFTPGASPISAVATGERIFVVIVLATSMIVATCFVGSISVTMGTVWAANRYNSHQGFLLKKFLQQRGISRELGSQVTRYVECVVELRQKVVPIGRVEYLKLLSGPLSVELHTMIYQPYLAAHRFFKKYLDVSRTALRQLCSTSVETESYAKHDTVFPRGQAAKKMYFVTRGALAYRFANAQKSKQTVKLDVNSTIADPALWVAWKYHGHLKGLSDCEVLNLHSLKFWDVTSKANSSVFSLAREEAFSFAARLRSCTSFGPGYVNDIPHEQMALLLSEREVSKLHDIARAEHYETELLGFSDSESESSDDNDSHLSHISQRS